MTTVEILRAAKALLDTPEKWWDGEGETMAVLNEGRHCAMTAVTTAAYPTRGAHTPAHEALRRVMGVPFISMFNDSHTHAEVVAAFDAAIANEEAKAQEFTVTAEPVAA